jgi:hypothetical protein
LRLDLREHGAERYSAQPLDVALPLHRGALRLVLTHGLR